MGERVKGIMGSPFKRTSKFLSHQVFNRWVHSEERSRSELLSLHRHQDMKC